MTFNGVMAIILRYFTEFGSLWANYVTVAKLDSYCLRQSVAQKHYGDILTPSPTRKRKFDLIVQHCAATSAMAELSQILVGYIKRRLAEIAYIRLVLLGTISVFSRTTYAVTVSSCSIDDHCRPISLLPVNRCSVASVVCLLLLISPSVSVKVRRLSSYWDCLSIIE